MIAAAFFLFSTLLAQGYAAPANFTDAADEVIEVKLDMNDFSHGVHPFQSGKIRDKLDIPELVNMTLLRQNDSLIYDIPEEGIDISPELYEEITGHAPKYVKNNSKEQSSRLTIDFIKRPWNKRNCNNPCNWGTYRQYSLMNAEWSRFYGDITSVSSPLCGPGSITKTFTLSYSYSVSGSFGVNAVSASLFFVPIDCVRENNFSD